MKKIEINLSELSNPEYLSPEKMKNLFGGDEECLEDTNCDYQNHVGTCAGGTKTAHGCLCHANGQSTYQIECIPV